MPAEFVQLKATRSVPDSVGPLAAGLAYERVGQATPYALAALVMALTAMLVVRGQPRRSTAPAAGVLASLPAPE